MIKISQGDFGQKIKEVLRGEKTLMGLCKELQTDERKLIQNIILHSAYDPEVYAEFLEKHPYRTREREDIDFSAAWRVVIPSFNISMQKNPQYSYTRDLFFIFNYS